MDAATGRELGGYCIDQQVQPVSPPRLISPLDGVIVEEPYPLFAWTPPTPLTPGEPATYKLTIVEMLEGQVRDI